MMKNLMILSILVVLVSILTTACALAVPGVASSTTASTSAADSVEGYTVHLTPADFVDVVDNPYFPRISGSKYVYEGQTGDGFERVELQILNETKEVMGVKTTIMRDTAYQLSKMNEPWASSR
jgi:predicted small secreted protein